jgi:hypothetical protein
VLVAPTEGFEAARRSTEKRTRAGESPAEGYAPFVLAALGGASLFVLWLKVSALLGLRDVTVADFRWAFLAAAGLMGAMMALAAQALFGIVAARFLRTGPSQLRMVWGASAFPQVFALAVLLPCDILVVGPEAFTTANLSDPVSSAWAAVSIAVGVALALWSWGLLFKGVAVVAGLRIRVALGVTLVAGACLAVIVVLIRSGAIALMESLT